MPQPVEVAAIRDELNNLYEQAWRSIEQQLADLARNPSDRNAVLRRRLTEISRDVTSAMDELDFEARGWLQQRLPLVYEIGGVAGADALGDRFSWSQHHHAAVQQLARTSFDDLLAASGVRSGMANLPCSSSRVSSVPDTGPPRGPYGGGVTLMMRGPPGVGGRT